MSEFEDNMENTLNQITRFLEEYNYVKNEAKVWRELAQILKAKNMQLMERMNKSFETLIIVQKQLSTYQAQFQKERDQLKRSVQEKQKQYDELNEIFQRRSDETNAKNANDNRSLLERIEVLQACLAMKEEQHREALESKEIECSKKIQEFEKKLRTCQEKLFELQVKKEPKIPKRQPVKGKGFQHPAVFNWSPENKRKINNTVSKTKGLAKNLRVVPLEVDIETITNNPASTQPQNDSLSQDEDMEDVKDDQKKIEPKRKRKLFNENCDKAIDI